METKKKHIVDIIVEPIAEKRVEDASEIVNAIQKAAAAYLATFATKQLPVIS